MPWTSPNLLLLSRQSLWAGQHAKSGGPLFVNCGRNRTYHNTDLDVSRLPDDMTFTTYQPTECSAQCATHRGDDVGQSWLHHGMIGRARAFDEPNPLPADPARSLSRTQTLTIMEAAEGTRRLLEEWTDGIGCLIGATRAAIHDARALGMWRARNRERRAGV